MTQLQEAPVTPTRNRTLAPSSPSPLPITAAFSFNPPSRSPNWPSPPDKDNDIDMGSDSPRSKVALHFRGLALDAEVGVEVADGDGRHRGGVSLPGQREPHPHAPNDGVVAKEEEEASQRRWEKSYYQFDSPTAMDVARDHSDDYEYGDAPLTMRERSKHSASPGPSPPPSGPAEEITPQPAQAQEMMPPTLDGDAPRQISPATSRTPDTISPPRKRAKSPSSALGKRASKKARQRAKAAAEAKEEDEHQIVDPVRAALTWQEDEITVYDPDDADDDGTGMDGVGFLAPPAAARATAQKKMRQLAEYRRMVQREARAGRNQRRRGAAAANAEEGNGRVTRVRFLEPEATITFG